MEYIKLNQVCAITMGQSPSSDSYNEDGEGVPFYQGNADFGEKYPIPRNWCTDPKKYADPEDILISVRAPIGALNYAKKKCCIGRGLAALKPNIEKVLPEYVYLFLKSKKVELNRKGTGSTFKAISKKVLEEVSIPQLSIENQKDCVDKLLIIEKIIRTKKQELNYLDLLIKARFIEMFGDPVINPMKWEKVKLNTCLRNIENGKSFICDGIPRIEENPAILKLSAVTNGTYNPEENKAIIDKNDFVESAEVHKGDLLFTRKNTPELVGMAAYVSSTPGKLMMPDLIFRLNTNLKCNKVYLWKLINHDLFRKQIQNIASGSAKSMSNISKARLENLSICLPPIKQQDQFADFVQQVDKSKFGNCIYLNFIG